MSKWKKSLAVVLLIILALCLTACQESNESKYKRADKLLTEGKYDEAIKVFDELGTYEDSSKLSMYAKAITAAENGDYKSAITGFQALGDYKDCPMMITYYTARQYESQATDTNWSPRIMAAEAYDTVALFLDSKDRAENNRKTVYDGAVHLANLKQYYESMEMLSALRDYEDSALLRRYFEAFNLEQENKFTEASRAFAALDDYKDSKDQAAEVLKRGYQEADAQERLGKQEESYQIFMNLAESEYEDSFERANKPYYDLGMSLRAEKKWPDAIRAFEHAGTYSDAETQVKETKYMQACDKREQHNWDAAIEIFTVLGDYKDSTTVQINETNYQRADALEKEGKQEEAYKLFVSLGRYGDSFVRANKPYYDLGIAKREAGEWDEAVAAFEHAGTYEDASEQIKETRYLKARFLYEQGDYTASCAEYKLIRGYKDADSILKTDIHLHEALTFSYRQIGNIVTFGYYEQDNNTANGSEAIEWIVLDYGQEEHKALLLSKYGLDAKPYNVENEEMTWEKCTLRNWLNGGFLPSAFSEHEQSAILMSMVDNSASQGYSEWNTDGGNNTQDQVFLLSYTEANRYLDVTWGDSNNTKARVAPTAYAIANGAWAYRDYQTADGETVGWWWLRSPGSLQSGAAVVLFGGSLNDKNVSGDNCVVRPAFWLNLDSDIF